MGPARSTYTLTLAFAAIISATLVAADLSGTWSAQTPAMDGGTSTTTFEFQVADKTLTGTVKMSSGDYAIQDGVVDGETIRFSITVNMGRDVKFVHTGIVSGDEIRFTRELQGMGRRATFVATRSR